MYPARVVSGMHPTGAMHLGHYHGALKNRIKLQSEFPCLFFVADWHALMTHYDGTIETSTWDMVNDWLAAGVDPTQAMIFIQSQVPENAELHLFGARDCCRRLRESAEVGAGKRDGCEVMGHAYN